MNLKSLGEEEPKGKKVRQKKDRANSRERGRGERSRKGGEDGKRVQSQREGANQSQRMVEGQGGGWGGRRRGEGSGDSLLTVFFFFFSSSVFICLFCKHRQSQDQNIETVKSLRAPETRELVDGAGVAHGESR